MNFAVGDEALMFFLISVFLVLLYMLAVIVTHVKVIRLSASEAVLLAMFSSTLSLMAGLLIGGQNLLAFYVFVLFLVFTVLLFVKKANRWYLERAGREAMSREVSKELKESGLR